MADDYMQQLSAATGLTHYPGQGPFGDKKGTVMGKREGYLVAAGPMQTDENNAALGLVVRFLPVEEPEVIKAALNNVPELAKRGKLGQITPDMVQWNWTYTIKKPAPAEVEILLSGLVSALKGVAPTFDGRCEMCRNASALDITLLNGIPGNYCSMCQEKTRAELDTVASDYEAQPANLPRGFFFGAMAALVGAAAWGLVAYFLERIFLWGAILIGWFVVWALIKGMGKVTRAGQVLAVVLTLVSVLLGDFIFFTLAIAKEMGVPLGLDLLAGVADSFLELEKEQWGSLLFALAGAGFALYRMRKPQFVARFEPLGAPQS